MEAIISLGMGYFIGCISPSAWISKKKHVDLTKEGTKNLGATNTAYVLGKKAGIFVMIFDMGKSVFSYKLARMLFPSLLVAGILACIGTIVGHCYPVTMHFQGGKGLAAFGGMILAYKPAIFLTILLPGLVLMAVLNTGVVMPMLASVMFPILVYLDSGNWDEVFASIVACVFILIMHRDNIHLARKKQDVVNTKEFFAKVFGK